MDKPKFDPNKPFKVAGGEAEKPKFDPSAPFEAAPEGAGTGQAQTALEHGANAATLGYLPQLQAAAAPIIYKGLNLITGQNVEPDSYVNERDQNIKRMDAQQERNPGTALAAQVGGTLLGAAAMPTMGAAGGVGRAALQGAGYGAAYGLAQNPGDTQGVVDPLQADQRAENALTGAITGGVTGGVTHAAGKAIKGLANSSKSLKDLADTQAVKASGAMLKDFRALEGKDKTGELGRYALDRGIVKAGDTLESVAQKAEIHTQSAGTLLDGVYKQAMGALEDPAVAEKMPGFNPVKDKPAILSEVSKEMGNATGKAGALQKIETYLDQLAKDHGDKVLDPRVANDVKTEIDKTINYLRNPLSAEPAAEQAFKNTRGVLAKKIEESVDYLGKASGNDDLAAQLKSANKEYGFAKQIKNMATDKLQRMNANRHFSLTDTIAGGAGGVAGSAAGAALGGDYKHAGEFGLLGGAVGAVSHHVGKQYGNAAVAGGLDTAGSLARYTAAPVGRALNGALPPGMLTRGLIGTSRLRSKRGLIEAPKGMIMPISDKDTP